MASGGYRANAGRPRRHELYWIYRHVKQKGWYIKRTVKGEAVYIGYAETIERAIELRTQYEATLGGNK